MDINPSSSPAELQDAYDRARVTLRTVEAALTEAQLQVENIETFAVLTGVKLVIPSSAVEEAVA